MYPKVQVEVIILAINNTPIQINPNFWAEYTIRLFEHWHTLGREREVVFPYITLTGVKMIDS